MNVLTKQLNVLWEIAKIEPRAHIAFLGFQPYRNMYDNPGSWNKFYEAYGTWELAKDVGNEFLCEACRFIGYDPQNRCPFCLGYDPFDHFIETEVNRKEVIFYWNEHPTLYIFSGYHLCCPDLRLYTVDKYPHFCWLSLKTKLFVVLYFIVKDKKNPKRIKSALKRYNDYKPCSAYNWKQIHECTLRQSSMEAREWLKVFDYIEKNKSAPPNSLRLWKRTLRYIQ